MHDAMKYSYASVGLTAFSHSDHLGEGFRSVSLIKKRTLRGSYRKSMPKVLGGS